MVESLTAAVLTTRGLDLFTCPELYGMSVASIRGGPLPGEPRPKVVAMLERYLEQAKAGEIDGAAIAISVRTGDGRSKTSLRAPRPEIFASPSSPYFLPSAQG